MGAFMNKLKSALLWLRDKLLEWAKEKPVFKALMVWIVFLFFFAIFVDKLFMPLFAGEFATTGTVPSLEGLSVEAAEASLEEAGFKAEWQEEGRYSAQVPAGMVLVQMPAAGRTAKLGRTVKLTKSLGLREVEIPDLRGKSQKQAEISLSRAGLVRGGIVKGAHQSIPRGVVIRTIPAAGKVARVGDTVKVVISAGAKMGKILLPNLTGQIIDNVYSRLERLGFEVGEIRREKGENGEAPGTILQTSPMYGDYLPPGSKVDFVVVD